jgi:hypothetical protein
LKTIKTIILILACGYSYGQGYNHQWLLGSYNLPQDPKGRAFINSSSFSALQEARKMVFKGTQGNICDSNGNFLMSSNGIWVANSQNDTMQNGSGLNPGVFASSWPYGFPLGGANIFLPSPGDSNGFFLFHQTGDPNLNVPSLELFYSEIDITLDGGLGGVTSKKNIIYQDTLSWGIGACKHSNGRDWWVVTMHDSSSLINVSILNNSGIASTNVYSLGFTPLARGNVAQLTFSPDGSKFITTTYDDVTNKNSFLVITDFDRCSGVFSNPQSVPIVSG